MSKELLLTIKELLFWVTLVACSVVVFVGNQYVGYRLAEKDILKSCISNSEFTIEGVRLVCIRCPTDKKAKEEE